MPSSFIISMHLVALHDVQQLVCTRKQEITQFERHDVSSEFHGMNGLLERTNSPKIFVIIQNTFETGKFNGVCWNI
jgi:hypothetical protein